MAKVYMEYTTVPAFRSIADIQRMLVQAGAISISQKMMERKVKGVSFILAIGKRMLSFELPARVEPVYQILRQERRRTPDARALEDLRKKAEDIAWRQLSRWLEAQLAIVGIGMVQNQEVFMPYCLGEDGRTMYEHWQGRLLEAPKAPSS